VDQTQFIIIETDQEGAQSIEREMKDIPDAKYRAMPVQMQTGAPPVWSVVAELATKSIAVLAATFLTLLGKGGTTITFEHPTLGKFQCHTIEEFERMVAVTQKVS
jgi:hypothetical protein